MARGNFSINIPHSKTQDEIEAIAMGIHMLADELKATTIRKAEAEKESEKYRRLLETIGDGVIELDQYQKVVYCNGSTLDIFHLAQDDLIGRSINELLLVKDTRVPLNLKKFPLGASSAMANAIVDGRILRLLLKVNVLPNRESTMISLSDITREYAEDTKHRVQDVLSHEDDREKIAYRINEEVGQVLNAVSLNISRASRQIETDKIHKKLMESKFLLSSSIKEVRKISKELSPFALNYGIKESIENLVEDASIELEDVNFSVRCINLESVRFDKSFEKMIYFVSKKILTVAVELGQITDVGLLVELRDEHLFIDYYDVGNGFESQQLIETPEIKSITDRVTAYDGSIRFDTECGMGLSVYMQFAIKDLLEV